MLGGGEHVALRSVDDDDAALGRLVDVDVVDADAGAAHDLQVGGRLDDLGGHLGGRADDETLVVGDAREQLVRVPVLAQVDLEAWLLEKLDPFGASFSLTSTFFLSSRLAHSGTSLFMRICSAAPTEAPNLTS